MTEDIQADKVKVDFEALLRNAKSVTSDITVSSVFPVIRSNEVRLGRLAEDRIS